MKFKKGDKVKSTETGIVFIIDYYEYAEDKDEFYYFSDVGNYQERYLVLCDEVKHEE